MVRDARGQPVTAAAATAPGQQVAIEFHDDSVGAVIAGAPKSGTGRDRPSRPRGKGDDKQGSLL